MIATSRAIDLATRHAHRFHVLHVSTGAETELLKEYFAGVGDDPARGAGCEQGVCASDTSF